MTARVWPVDAVTGAPSYTGRSLRQTQVAVALGGATAARPLGGISGVRPGTSSSIATATSTTWTVTPFAGSIDGEALAIAGPYLYAFDANVTGSVTAAAGSARVDRLDVQVSDPAESDGSSVPAIAVVYNAGVPGSGVPVAAPARSHPLALINVPASGGGSPTVSWIAAVCFAAGGVPPVNNAFQRDSTFQYAGMQGSTVDRLDLGYQEKYYAIYNSSTNPMGAKAAGWYPAPGGIMPGGLQVRSAAAQSLTSGGYTLLPAGFFSELLAGASRQQGLSTPFATNGGYRVDVDGVYDVSFYANFAAGSGGLVVVKKNDATAAQTGQVLAQVFTVIAGASAVAVQGRLALLAGDILRVAVYCASGSTIAATPTDAAFGLRYVEPIRA